MADPKVSQSPVEVITQDDGEARVSQNPVEVIHTHISTTRTSQSPIEVVENVLPPPIRTSQMVIEIVGKGLFEQEFVNVCVMT